jgi:antitoxin (DNA-binding transcriptional repressor) of toxin-antitoxin stability system
MREVEASDGETQFLQWLDDVEQGETVIIVRGGRPIPRLVRDPLIRQARVTEAIAAIKALRKTTGKTTLEELLSFRHEGHKY